MKHLIPIMLRYPSSSNHYHKYQLYSCTLRVINDIFSIAIDHRTPEVINETYSIRYRISLVRLSRTNNFIIYTFSTIVSKYSVPIWVTQID